MPTRILTAAGLAVLVAAPIILLLTGRTELATSADPQADTVTLAAVVVPYLVGLLLIRLIPPRLPALERAIDGERADLRRQGFWLIGLAVLFSVTVLTLPEIYYIFKVIILLGCGWYVLRRFPGRSPGPAHRDRLPRLWYWLGPALVLLGWGYLFFYSPLIGERDLSGYETFDKVELAIIMLFTFLTASVLEEVFYRVMLQTRLEAVWGRWPAITATALLFVLMHVHRYQDGPFVDMTLLILVSNGGLGLFAGYLWSRYRNFWSLILAHGAINSLALLPIFF